MAECSAGIGFRFVSFFLALLVVGTSSPAAQSKEPPQVVMIIRHAEKPAEEAGSVSLSPEGKKRAAALHELFKTTKARPDPFPVPEYVFTTKDSKHSHRPFETVSPLARELKLGINSAYPNEEYAKLAKDILDSPKYSGKTILICWHHGTLPHLAKALKAADAPETWRGEVFDRVWQLDYDKQGKVTFRDRPQQLLAQDSNK
jgi:hypothetical protein